MIYLLLNILLMGTIYLILRCFFPAALQRVRAFYILVFSTIIGKLKQLLAWNKGVLSTIKTKYQTGNKLLAIVYLLGYVGIVLVQVLLLAFIFISYLMCKLTGVCILI